MGVCPAAQSQTRLVLPAHIARMDPPKVTTSCGRLGREVPGFEFRFFFSDALERKPRGGDVLATEVGLAVTRCSMAAGSDSLLVFKA